LIEVKTIWQILSNISFAAVIITLMLMLLFRRKLDSGLRFYTYVIILGVAAEITMRLCIYLFKIPNLFVIPAYYILEFFLISYLYIKYMLKRPQKALIVFAALVQIILCVEGIRSIFYDQVYSFNAYGKVLVNTVVIIYTLLYLLQLAKGYKRKSVSELTLNMLIFIYYVLTLIVYVFINFLINGTSSITMYFWIFHSFITILFYLSISVLIWKTGTDRKLLLFGLL
jgi:hypothetical protein